TFLTYFRPTELGFVGQFRTVADSRPHLSRGAGGGRHHVRGEFERLSSGSEVSGSEVSNTSDAGSKVSNTSDTLPRCPTLPRCQTPRSPLNTSSPLPRCPLPRCQTPPASRRGSANSTLLSGRSGRRCSSPP